MRLLPLALTCAFAALAGCAPEGAPPVPHPAAGAGQNAAPTPASGVASGVATSAGPSGICTAAPVFEAPALNPCAGPSARLAFVGDVLPHVQLARYGYQVGFHSVWAQPERYLQSADIAVANLEGAVAPGLTASGAQLADPGPVIGAVYSGYPQFNYHPVLLRDLKAAGVDLVTTANNHALDRGARGADLTLAEAARAGLATVGTAAGSGGSFVTRRASTVGTLAFIACSFGTNGNADPKHQVLLCYDDRAKLLSLVRREAADPAVAGVIVLPHWGKEYSSSPGAAQQGLARELAAAGATLVVGTHPHAVQPFAAIPGPAGQVPVVYSTGNFIATQDFMPSKVEAMALVDLCRAPSGKAVAARAGWVAMQMSFTSRGYWVDLAPRGAPGYAGAPEAWLRKIAPGWSAQPAACGG